MVSLPNSCKQKTLRTVSAPAGTAGTNSCKQKTLRTVSAPAGTGSVVTSVYFGPVWGMTKFEV